jgi:hypothetical protein
MGRRYGGEHAQRREAARKLRRVVSRAREEKREREGVDEFPLTTTKLRSGDVVEERQWNGSATAAGSSSKSGGAG